MSPSDRLPRRLSSFAISTSARFSSLHASLPLYRMRRGWALRRWRRVRAAREAGAPVLYAFVSSASASKTAGTSWALSSTRQAREKSPPRLKPPGTTTQRMPAATADAQAALRVLHHQALVGCEPQATRGGEVAVRMRLVARVVAGGQHELEVAGAGPGARGSARSARVPRPSRWPWAAGPRGRRAPRARRRARARPRAAAPRSARRAARAGRGSLRRPRPARPPGRRGCGPRAC